FTADDDVSTLWRRDPAPARPSGHFGTPRATLSARPGVGRDTGAVADRHPWLHGRAQSPGAGAVDHACRDSDQRAAVLSLDLRRVGIAAARPVRRGPRHHAR